MSAGIKYGFTDDGHIWMLISTEDKKTPGAEPQQIHVVWTPEQAINHAKEITNAVHMSRGRERIVLADPKQVKMIGAN